MDRGRTAQLARRGGGFLVRSLALFALGVFTQSVSGANVYRWVDADGIVHLSSDKPPAGVSYETVSVSSKPGKTASAAKKSGTTATKSNNAGAGPRTPAEPQRATAAPQAAAARAQVLATLGNRECVIALEGLDRLTSGAQATTADEIRRLQQTAEANCSKEPAIRRTQEEIAAQLRVANSPVCAQARNKLWDMLEPGAKVAPAQLKAQQDFVDQRCTSPIR